MDQAQPEPACTIVTIDGVEVARTEALDSGRAHSQQPRLAIVTDGSTPFTDVIAQEHPVELRRLGPTPGLLVALRPAHRRSGLSVAAGPGFSGLERGVDAGSQAPGDAAPMRALEGWAVVAGDHR
jgi:hypothetical protein